MAMTMQRGQWNWPSSRQAREDGIYITSGEGGLTIEVSSDVDLGSHNEQFETSVTLTREIALELHAWLGQMLGKE